MTTESAPPPAPPSRLSGVALDEWQRLAPLLAAEQVLTARDVQALAIYCELLGEYLADKARADTEDPISHGGKNGAPYPNPIVGIVNKKRELLLKYAKRLGLDPESRGEFSRDLDAEEREAADRDRDRNDPMAKLLKEIDGE